MTRRALIKSIRKCAEKHGYNFYTGFEYRINNDIKMLPAIWLFPPKASAKYGIAEGVVNYTIDLKIFEKCKDQSPEQKEKQWAAMEFIVSEICSNLCEDPLVKAITNITHSPSEMNLTHVKDISLHVQLMVQIPY